MASMRKSLESVSRKELEVLINEYEVITRETSPCDLKEDRVYLAWLYDEAIKRGYLIVNNNKVLLLAKKREKRVNHCAHCGKAGGEGCPEIPGGEYPDCCSCMKGR